MYTPQRLVQAAPASLDERRTRSSSAPDTLRDPLTDPLSSMSEAVSGSSEPDQAIDFGALTFSEKVSQVSHQLSGSGGAGTQRILGSELGAAAQKVVPSGKPAEVSGGGNTCQPAPPDLAWDVVESGTDWVASVSSVALKGTVKVTEWPSKPASLEVPNTANAVDGGNLNNKPGSNNNWKVAVANMEGYDKSGGGAGPYWHSTAASSAHEWAHWNQDFIGDTVPASDWASSNTAIDAMRVPKSTHPKAADARAALAPGVKTEFSAWVLRMIKYWGNDIGSKDVPGGGGRGYAAGAAKLAPLISAVKAYASTKGWDKAPAKAPPETDDK